MQFAKKIALPLMLALSAVCSQASADITLTITENTTLGGTDWAFSGGSGSTAGMGLMVLVGDTTDQPLNFMRGSFAWDGSLTVLAGTNKLGLTNAIAYTYGWLDGTEGMINQGFDLQSWGGSWDGDIGTTLNGFAFNADGIAYSHFNPGTYELGNYYPGYGSDLGKFTLNIGAAQAPTDVPEPASLAILGLGLLGLGAARKNKRKA